uniref:Rev protein n=1 Tax=Caprine arthritis encephalitis virus TaxID=11660 RepID=Q9DKV5_CAEV|nr:rev protein [Caprine arthritis encephalitis virus]
MAEIRKEAKEPLIQDQVSTSQLGDGDPGATRRRRRRRRKGWWRWLREMQRSRQQRNYERLEESLGDLEKLTLAEHMEECGGGAVGDSADNQNLAPWREWREPLKEK